MGNLGHLNFDADKEEPMDSFDAIPAGKYRAMIVESEFKTPNSGKGQYLKLKFQILVEGEFKGRKLFANLNLDHAKENVVKIARSELSSICKAIGIVTPQDSNELHHKPLVVRVAQKKREDTGEMGNEIKGYYKDGAEEGQPQQETGAKAPWAQ